MARLVEMLLPAKKITLYLNSVCRIDSTVAGSELILRAVRP